MRNPVAWILFGLLLLAEYWNYQHEAQLEAVCDALEIPDDLPGKATTALEKAQLTCYDVQNPADTDDDD